MNKEKEKIISDICPFYKEYGSCDRCNTAFDIDDPPCYFECMANAIIENNYRKSEWISVEERLPEHLQKILIYDEFQKMTVATYIAYSNGGGEWCTPVRINGEITHWMPLPEPPKKGGGE